MCKVNVLVNSKVKESCRDYIFKNGLQRESQLHLVQVRIRGLCCRQMLFSEIEIFQAHINCASVTDEAALLCCLIKNEKIHNVEQIIYLYHARCVFDET